MTSTETPAAISQQSCGRSVLATIRFVFAIGLRTRPVRAPEAEERSTIDERSLRPKVEAPGYYVVQATSRDVLAGSRLLGDNKEAAIAEIVPQIKTYTWTVEGAGEPMPARAAGDETWSQMPPRGMAYWDSLNEVIQRNPIDERDRFILAGLRFLRIERGQPFKPDERQTKLLEDGALVGEVMAKANTTDKRVEPPFWPGTHWKHALVVSVEQKGLTYDQLDERAAQAAGGGKAAFSDEVRERDRATRP